MKGPTAACAPIAQLDLTYTNAGADAARGDGATGSDGDGGGADGASASGADDATTSGADGGNGDALADFAITDDASPGAVPHDDGGPVVG